MHNNLNKNNITTKKLRRIANIVLWIILVIYLIFNFFNNLNTQNLNNSDININNSENNNLVNNSDNSDNFCNQFVKAWKYYKIWSDSNPKINLTHIYCWEINSKWNPSGLHFLKDWLNTETAKLKEINAKNSKWVYTADIEILDIKNNIYKNKFSSIFPNNLTKKELEKAILNAWENKEYYKSQKFRWPSGLGFKIEWYTLNWTSQINTAYPIYTKN